MKSFILRYIKHTLQRHNTENSKQILTGKELRGYTVPIPTYGTATKRSMTQRLRHKT